jgi:hypothetical protein
MEGRRLLGTFIRMRVQSSSSGFRMASLYEMFDEIDEEMCFVMDCVSAIRDMVEKGQKRRALEALVALEDEIADFMTVPDEGEEEEWEEEGDEEEGEEEGEVEEKPKGKKGSKGNRCAHQD